MRSESVWDAGNPAGANRLRVPTHAGMMPGTALSPFVLSKKASPHICAGTLMHSPSETA